MNIEADALPRSVRRFVLDVMPRDDSGNDWVALFIDVEPELHAREYVPTQSLWLNLGRHRSRDEAQLKAWDLIATRH